MKLNLDPTVPKVIIVAFLIFLEGIVINVYSVLQNGRWPNSLEIATFVLGAVIQLITYLLTFFQTGNSNPPANQPGPQPTTP